MEACLDELITVQQYVLQILFWFFMQTFDYVTIDLQINVCPGHSEISFLPIVQKFAALYIFYPSLSRFFCITFPFKNFIVCVF